MSVRHLLAVDGGGTIITADELVSRINSRYPDAGAALIEAYPTAVSTTARESGATDATAYVIAFDDAHTRGAYVHNTGYGAGYLVSLQEAAATDAARARRNGPGR